MSTGRRVPRVFTPIVGESRTLQYFKDDCDISLIVSKFAKTGELPHQRSTPPVFGDFANPYDFQQALNLVNDMEDQFSSLPSKVRARFENDPRSFLEFVSDPRNVDELVSLGLAVKRPLEANSEGSRGHQDGDLNPPRSEGSKA